MTARKRLLIDGIMLGTFVAAYKPFLTGLSLHEWLSLALFAPVLVHLVVNWDWAVRVIGRFLRRLRGATRLNLLVDVGLLVSVVTVMLSGLFVSQVIMGLLGSAGTAETIWHRVHSISADATIAFVALHLLLHLRWIVRAVRARSRGRAMAPESLGEGMVFSPVRLETSRVARGPHWETRRRPR